MSIAAESGKSLRIALGERGGTCVLRLLACCRLKPIIDAVEQKRVVAVCELGGERCVTFSGLLSTNVVR
jgi:hypothetical protein